MTTSRDKPLSQWTGDEIDQSIRAIAPHVVYSLSDLLAEKQRRQTRRTQLVATISTVAAAVAALGSAVAAIATLLKP